MGWLYSKKQTRARPEQGGKFAQPVGTKSANGVVFSEEGQQRGGSAKRGKLEVAKLLIPDPPASPVPLLPQKPTSLTDVDGWRKYLAGKRLKRNNMLITEVISRQEARNRGFSVDTQSPMSNAVHIELCYDGGNIPYKNLVYSVNLADEVSD